jgi:predicted NBD/HSP70 family sugar kinase
MPGDAPARRPGGRTAIAVRPPDAPRRPSLAVLLEHLHVRGSLSRAELTALMGVNRSTVAGLVTELAGLGAVVEERPSRGPGGAGRPSLVVSAVPARLQVLAAEIAVDRTTVALAGLGGRLGERRTAPTPRGPGSAHRLVELLCRLSDELQAGPDAAHVVGLGVAVPGAVRRSDGCVRFAPNLGWTDEPFGELLAQALPELHVVVGNDADFGVLAEHRRGVARDVEDVVFVNGDVGVGGGLVMGGIPLLGAGGYAGELGHMTVRPDGLPCRCGARGCWETEVGSPAIARTLAASGQRGDELTAAIRSARADGRGEALDRVARSLGVGIGNVVNLVNPRLVVLGGVFQEVLSSAGDQVRAAVEATALHATAEHLRLAPPQLGPDAVLAGAAEVVWQELLSDPVTLLQATA